MTDAGWTKDLNLKQRWATNLPELEPCDLSGQTMVVTGANTGIGYEIAKYLALHNAKKVILACRNRSKSHAAAASIAQETGRGPGVIESWDLDLSSYESVWAFARRYTESEMRLDVLFMNAAMSCAGEKKSRDGFDGVLQANHLGSTLLTILLFPILEKTGSTNSSNNPARVVWTSSGVISMTSMPPSVLTSPNPIDTFINEVPAPPAERMDLGIDYYGKSKLLAYVCSLEFARRIQNTVHEQRQNVLVANGSPGLVRTQLGQKDETGSELKLLDFETVFKGLSIRTPEEGARTIVLMGTYPVDKVWGTQSQSQSEGGAEEKVNVPWFRDMKGCTWEEFGPEVAKDGEWRKRVWKDTLKMIGVQENYIDKRFSV